MRLRKRHRGTGTPPVRAGVAYIPPAASGTVKLKLTSRGKRVVGTITKRRLRGVMEIRNTAGTAISSTRITFKLKKRP